MKTLYIVRDGYGPNTATNNRLMAFVKGFSEIGIEIKMIFIRPNEKHDRVIDTYPNVTYNYLWDNKNLLGNKYLKFLQQTLWILSFLKKREKGENIILFGTNEFVFLFALFWEKLNIYYEVTEHPEACSFKKNIKTKISLYVYLKGLKFYKDIFVITTSLKHYFETVGIDSKKIHIINMIVDSTRFDSVTKDVSKEKYIAYCGNVSNHKDGVDTLIKSFYLVSKKVTDLKLYIIGSFSFKTDEESDLVLINQYCLHDKIVFTGRIEAKTMPQILKNAQALVLARPDNLQAKHGFPTKLGEYLLTENPVVVTKTGDIPLFLKDGINAYLAEPNNVEDIADKIFHALTDENAHLIGKNGRTATLEYFNYLTETKKMYRVIFDKQL
jgi:glycosyltransferase involved in cell wall biosynthesis